MNISALTPSLPPLGSKNIVQFQSGVISRQSSRPSFSASKKSAPSPSQFWRNLNKLNPLVYIRGARKSSQCDYPVRLSFLDTADAAGSRLYDLNSPFILRPLRNRGMYKPQVVDLLPGSGVVLGRSYKPSRGRLLTNKTGAFVPSFLLAPPTSEGTVSKYAGFLFRAENDTNLIYQVNAPEDRKTEPMELSPGGLYFLSGVPVDPRHIDPQKPMNILLPEKEGMTSRPGLLTSFGRPLSQVHEQEFSLEEKVRLNQNYKLGNWSPCFVTRLFI